MAVLYLLIPISLIMGSLALWACLRAIKGGQYEDLESPKWRILFDENKSKTKEKNANHTI